MLSQVAQGVWTGCCRYGNAAVDFVSEESKTQVCQSNNVLEWGKVPDETLQKSSPHHILPGGLIHHVEEERGAGW